MRQPLGDEARRGPVAVWHRRLYCTGVFIRLCAGLTIVAVLSLPAVASTRLFCRYTGEEMVGCEAARSAGQAQVRDEGCCERQALAPLAEAQPFNPHSLTPGPPPLVTLLAPVSCPAPPKHGPGTFTVEAAMATGPPVFIAHRALII